ncbi:MAG: hypothetical protein KatS3mg085_338 [Candidatus Dojkabacteria bacterium]|nr:MAG: hypothetical protein KatS3mg085_338 [Candidatus Dojkabacteria bacterium]
MKKVLVLKTKKVNPADSLVVELSKFCDKDFLIDFASLHQDIVFKFVNGAEIFVNGKNILEYDLVYFRSWFGHYKIATAVSKYLIDNGIPVIDSALQNISLGGVTKIYQFLVLVQNNFPVPKSYVLHRDNIKNFLDEAVDALGGYPLIIKKHDGHKGEGIHKVDSESEFYEILPNLEDNYYFLQEFIPNDFDYRVLIMGNKVVRLKKRIRPENSTDFRNNVALGAKVELEDPKKNETVSNLGLKASKLLQIDIAGVDIVISSKDNKLYIFEVNTNPSLNNDITQYKDLANYLKSVVNN